MIGYADISIILGIILVVLILARLLALHTARVFTRAPSRLDSLLSPIESRILRLGGVDPARRMNWKEYFLALLSLNIAQMTIAFLILISQDRLPLNPLGFSAPSWDLALHTVVSFATNTNLQHYNGEAALSILSQMMAIQFLQFTSAATGICAGIAMVRGFVAHSKDLGNFYVDFVRALTRLLIPLCLVASLVFVALGVPQTLNASTTVTTVEGATQLVLVGPVASLDSIMQIGTNGGGFYGANAASPFQNPNPASNVFMIVLMLLVPLSMCFVFGDILGRKREARPVVIGALALLAINLLIAYIPDPSLGRGMEARLGGVFSVFWTVITTATSTGSLNASLSGMHPLTIFTGFMGMLIQATPGGDGVGLVYMIMYIVLTVFIVGLMSGRTPEYLGMKINARDVKLVMFAFLVHPIIILIPTAIAYMTGAVSAIGLSGNSVGFTQILYEFTTAAANNGSAFLGASGNTLFFNLSTAVVIILGRYAPMGIMLALSGSMIGRRRVGDVGLRTDSLAFSAILVGSILILVVLTFFPFLALGPILSWLQGNVNGFV